MAGTVDFGAVRKRQRWPKFFQEPDRIRYVVLLLFRESVPPALEMAMKHFALLVEKIDLTVKADEITRRLLAGRERAAKLGGETPR